ncbi:MAG: MBL fold metallo-hydrolase [Clostridium sp.]|uniref:MBL fold metallo-hydrolase n=1 Tax=Clostridium sp. TaxID=1506 RepID=UPI003F36171B
MIQFIGNGSAFNSSRGNNSAFIKGEESMVIIDCGGDVFHKLKEKELLNCKRLYIIITHTHPDHIGSLGDLIFYAHYIKNIKPKIFFPHKKTIEDILSYLGVSKELYDLESRYVNEFYDKEFKGVEIEFSNAKHVQEIPAYSFIFKMQGENFFYSGDTSEVNEEAVEMLKNSKISEVYHEVSSLDFKDSPHTSVDKLCSAFNKDLRKSVYCMHIDEELDEKHLIDLGFNITKTI